MASNPIVNTLAFAGSIAGQATFQAQGIGGDLTFFLPNIGPAQGQLITVQAVNGTNIILGWTNAQSIPTINWQSAQVLTGTVDGTNVTFTSPSALGANYVILVGGLILTPSVDYTVSGTTVTFTTAPEVAPVTYN